MEIYNYNIQDKEFTHVSIADEDPRMVGEFLIPSNATTKKPPLPKDSVAYVFDTEYDKWVSTPDHRGKMVWDIKTKEESIVDTLGPISVTTTLLPPPKFGVWSATKWTIDEEAKLNSLLEDVIDLADKKSYEFKNIINGSVVSFPQLERYKDKFTVAKRVLADPSLSHLLEAEASITGNTVPELATLIVGLGNAYDDAMTRANLNIEAVRIKAKTLRATNDIVGLESLLDRFGSLTPMSTDAEVLVILG